MRAFDQKLADEAATWRSANAPRGLPTCPNCRNRERAEALFGEDVWWCTAKPILPVFTRATVGNSTTGRIGHAINLALFDPASPYAARLNKEACPLFVALAGEARKG